MPIPISKGAFCCGGSQPSQLAVSSGRLKVDVVLEKRALTTHAPGILQRTWREIAVAPVAASQGIGIAVRKAMTSTIEWLRAKAPGFAHLSKNERDGGPS